MQSGSKFKIDISIYSGNKYRRKKTKARLILQLWMQRDSTLYCQDA